MKDAKTHTTTMWAATRKANDGEERVDTRTLGVNREETVNHIDADTKAAPQWAQANPVTSIQEFRITFEPNQPIIDQAIIDQQRHINNLVIAQGR